MNERPVRSGAEPTFVGQGGLVDHYTDYPLRRRPPPWEFPGRGPGRGPPGRRGTAMPSRPPWEVQGQGCFPFAESPFGEEVGP